MKIKSLAYLASFTCLTVPAFAQQSTGTDTTENTTVDDETNQDAIVVTGSRIKQNPNKSALPLQIITSEELTREGINSAEQFISFLSTNGNGGDNLASNADVVDGQQRGNNGLSQANLRGQGAAATLVLLNGRRVAAHGLNGAGVDVNQIPFAAVERVEVLKDGASAIYGTDAIGGVINFILKKDFQGVGVQGYVDLTEAGGGNRYRTSGIAGYGDIDTDGWNVMASVSYSWNKALRGNQRDFVNTFQPDRGVSVDTRGSPFATILPLAGTAFPNGASTPLIPGTTTNASGGINVLDLPGGPGCGVIDGQGPYDPVLWEFPEAEYACAWDTGRAAVLQQPINTLTYLGRAVFRLGSHEFSAEVTGSDADSAKRFSNLQLTPNTSTRNYAYRRTAANGATFDNIANRLIAAFPTLGPQIAANPSFAYRWRCIECGPREIETNVKTARVALGVEGPLFEGWDYRTGFSYAQSQAQSVLGSGYYYQNALIAALNQSVINPFLFPGETQSQAALDLLASTSAKGVTLYGGKYSVRQLDGSVSGSLFDLPGGKVQLAVGLDYRKENYRFNGDVREAASRPVILAAPFDDGNALEGVSRTIKAAYVEALLPVFEGFEITAAARIDDYSGFGSTTNPKIALKYQPFDALLFRASYNTGFRAPTFNQIFNGSADEQYTGRDIADPQNCPGGVPNAAIPGCVAIQPDIRSGGKSNLGPETAKQYNVGVVFQPTSRFSASLDYWSIKSSNTIQILDLRQLIDNYQLFPNAFIRDSAGNLTVIDQSWLNAGGSITQGLELALRGEGDVMGGVLSAGLDGTYLLKKKERIIQTEPYGPSQIGVFTFSDDLGLRWKHNAYVNFAYNDWSGNLSQIFRSGYTNQELPGVTNGSVTPPGLVKKVKDYVTYNMSLSYTGYKYAKFTFGVKNIFDTDPPFAITYDSNTGAGSSWEPRVADPRGRAFTFLADFKF